MGRAAIGRRMTALVWGGESLGPVRLGGREGGLRNRAPNIATQMPMWRVAKALLVRGSEPAWWAHL